MANRPTARNWRDAPPPHSALRATFGEMLRFDLSGLTIVPALRVALGVCVALIVGLATASRAGGATMAAGALLTGIPTVVGARRLSLAAMATIAAAMGLSVFVGSVTGNDGWVHTAILVPWCLVGGLLVGLDSPGPSVGTQAIAAMIVFGRFASSPLGAAQLTGYVLAGSGIAILLVVLTRPPLAASAQRQALAATCSALATLARAARGRRSGVASAEALERAEGLLRRQLGDRRDWEGLRALYDVLARCRLAILAVDGLERRDALWSGSARERAAADSLAAAADTSLLRAASLLDALAQQLRKPGGDRPEVFELPTLTVPDGVGDAVGSWAEAMTGHLETLAGQLRAAVDLVEHSDSGRRSLSPSAIPLRGATVPRPAVRVRAQALLDALRADATIASPAGRHAFRLAVVVTLAEVIALHTPLSRGYWVALTASVVLRPDFSSTFSRGLARTVGTSLGVLLAGLLTLVVHRVDALDVAMIGVLCVGACATFQVSYVLFSGFLTGLVVLIVGVVSPGTVPIALARLLDTVIGGALALVAYAVWPTWSKTTAPRSFANLLDALAAYLGATFSMVTGERPVDPTALRPLARAARRARADAESVITRANSEPARSRPDLDALRGDLAAVSRVSLTTHAMRVGLEAGRHGAPVPEAATLASALVEALRACARHFRAWQPTPALDARSALGLTPERSPDEPQLRPLRPPLRPLQRELAAELSGRSEVAALLGETDELVDAVDTLTGLLGLEPSAEPAHPGQPASAD